jgi:hypothetical protein
LTFADRAEAEGRQLLRDMEPPPPIKRTVRYRERLTEGRLTGTVWIDRHGVFAFRPLRRRKVYRVTVASLAMIVVQREAMAEAARVRAERGGKKLVRRGR